MTWSTLRSQAEQLGFDVAYLSHAAESGGYLPECHTPPSSGNWICLGAFEQSAGLWVKPAGPMTEDWTAKRLASTLAQSHPFLAPMAAYDADYAADFLETSAAWLRAAADPDSGRMPA